MQELSFNIKRLLEDFCHTDAKVREVCLEVLTELEVYGNSKVGMPSLENVVKLLVQKIEGLR